MMTRFCPMTLADMLFQLEAETGIDTTDMEVVATKPAAFLRELVNEDTGEHAWVVDASRGAHV